MEFHLTDIYFLFIYLFIHSTQGNVRIFDIRHKSSLHNWDVGGDATAMAVHPAADIMAW